MTYPRYRNGHVATGVPIRASNRRTTCPKCGSARYLETLSRERCESCGLEMDYWGGGANSVYDAWEAARHAQEERAREEQSRREWETERDWSE